MHARIVIVDDRSTNLRVYAQYVAMMGPEFSAKCFHSAIDALQWLETETADLLVVDYRMPDMNGAEFISKRSSMLDIAFALSSVDILSIAISSALCLAR